MPVDSLLKALYPGQFPSCAVSPERISWESGNPFVNQAPLLYLALDVGSKRIGVAVSDELGLTAQPVMTLARRRNPREDVRSLARLARKYAVAAIVVGDPLSLSGQAGTQSRKTRAFAEALGGVAGCPIHLWDERLTSQAAHELLYQAGRPRQEHRRVVDQVAATLILQSFLDDRARVQSRPPEAEA